MKIAVPYSDGQVFQHFGKSEQFKIYDTIDDEIISSEIVDTSGSGHSALADFLKEKGAGVLICGGIGVGAVTALQNAGIQIWEGQKARPINVWKNSLAEDSTSALPAVHPVPPPAAITTETGMKKNVTVISAPAAPGVIDAKTVDKKITINLITR